MCNFTTELSDFAFSEKRAGGGAPCPRLSGVEAQALLPFLVSLHAMVGDLAFQKKCRTGLPFDGNPPSRHATCCSGRDNCDGGSAAQRDTPSATMSLTIFRRGYIWNTTQHHSVAGSQWRTRELLTFSSMARREMGTHVDNEAHCLCLISRCPLFRAGGTLGWSG